MKHFKPTFAKYEPRECARCSKSHFCTLTIHCPCFEIEISDKEMDYLTAHFDDCLCENCLKAIKSEAGRISNGRCQQPA